jgi:hypothetical protein
VLFQVASVPVMPGPLHGCIYVDAGGNTLDEQGPEHAGRVSGTDCAAIVERELAQAEGGDGPEDEMNPMMGGQARAHAR